MFIVYNYIILCKTLQEVLKKTERKSFMKYQYCFLDLDGTVIDSSPGITQSVQYALRKSGITPPPAEELLGFIGPALSWSFAHFFGMDNEAAHRAVDFYRENYRAGGMFECRVYEGIADLLKSLQAAGIPCVLATCKPHCFAEQILRHFGIDRYFTFVSGPELDGTRGEKHEVIVYAMQHLGITDPTSVLMVGDRASDITDARLLGVDAAGVLWGFGSEKELTDAGAVMLCQAPQELLAILNA